MSEDCGKRKGGVSGDHPDDVIYVVWCITILTVERFKRFDVSAVKLTLPLLLQNSHGKKISVYKEEAGERQCVARIKALIC